jgi:hypothetical protein
MDCGKVDHPTKIHPRDCSKDRGETTSARQGISSKTSFLRSPIDAFSLIIHASRGKKCNIRTDE